jgi:hypothetical protein
MIFYDLNNANVSVGDRLLFLGYEVNTIVASFDKVVWIDTYDREHSIHTKVEMTTRHMPSSFKQYKQYLKTKKYDLL